MYDGAIKRCAEAKSNLQIKVASFCLNLAQHVPIIKVNLYLHYTHCICIMQRVTQVIILVKMYSIASLKVRHTWINALANDSARNTQMYCTSVIET